jgi:hypothetical protein
MLTWGTYGNKESYEKLTGSSGHKDNLIYGLIKNGGDRIIKIDEKTDRFISILNAQFRIYDVIG